jgi:vitamin B12 transporter
MLSGSYTLLSTRVLRSNTPNSPVTGVGQELIRRPRHSGSVALSLAPRRWFFRMGAILTGERQDMDGVGFGITRSPAYQNVYAVGSFRATRHLSPLLRMDNLLNSRYQEVLGYSAPSRSLRGGIRLEW